MNKEYLFDMRERLNNMKNDMTSIKELMGLWIAEIDEFMFVINKDLEDYEQISVETKDQNNLDHFFYLME